MACKGECELKRYSFDRTFKTEVASSSGASALSSDEIKSILAAYFEPIAVTECRQCAQPADPNDKCVCVPTTDPPRKGSLWKMVDLPEPVVATAGADTYTITGPVDVNAEILIGICRDPKQLPPPPKPAGRSFDVKKKFIPKPGAKCGCDCERQVYSFKGTANTVVKGKGKKVPAMPLTGAQLDKWIADSLKGFFGQPGSQYQDDDITACDGDCDCVHISTSENPPEKIALKKAVEVLYGTDIYMISGEIEVTAQLFKGVCTPTKFVLQGG